MCLIPGSSIRKHPSHVLQYRFINKMNVLNLCVCCVFSPKGYFRTLEGAGGIYYLP